MYLSRQDWGAVPSRRIAPVPPFDRTHLFLHSEDLPWSDLRSRAWSIQFRDMYYLNLPDIRYNFLLAGSTLIEGRGWLEPGYVMANGLCLCLLGEPSRSALQSFYEEADYRIGHPLIRQAISEKEAPYLD